MPRLGIPNLQAGETLHDAVSDSCTSLPQSIALGATFDPQLFKKIATVIARESRANGMTLVYRNSTGELLKGTDVGKSFKPGLKVKVRSSGVVAAPGRDADLWLPAGASGMVRIFNGAIENIRLFQCATVGFGRGRTDGDGPSLQSESRVEPANEPLDELEKSCDPSEPTPSITSNPRQPSPTGKIP